jgi:sporulation protein YlmC with PRC-barrel domain
MEDIIGKEVLDSSAMIIGKVKDIELNAETNEIEAFIISKGGISESLGLSGSEVVIPYDRIKQVGDKILLESNMEYAL